MNLAAAQKKFKKLGFSCNSTYIGTYNGNYIAQRDNCQIEFIHNIGRDIVHTIRLHTTGSNVWKAPSLTAALRESGFLHHKTSQTMTRSSLFKRFKEGLSIDNKTLLNAKFVSQADVQTAMESAVPQYKRLKMSPRYRTRQRTYGYDAAVERMWKCIVSIATTAYDQPPLRSVKVSTKVEMSHVDVAVLRAAGVSSSITGTMLIFAHTDEQACSSVRTMLGGMSDITGTEVVAVGPNEESMRSTRENFEREMAVQQVVRERTNIENAIKRMEQSLVQLKQSQEFLKKKMDIANFIDGVTNMVSMLDQQ